jgi:hypothetical protein
MHADSSCGGQLYIDAMVLEGHAVIAGVTRFRTFVERAFVFVPPHFTRAKLRAWHDQNVSVVTHACALEVGVTEAIDDAVRVVISAAAIPTL